jgi:hypothetical protein
MKLLQDNQSTGHTDVPSENHKGCQLERPLAEDLAELIDKTQLSIVRL